MYLRYQDYKPYIQDANLQQVITSDDALRLQVEQVAEEEAISYLRQKYDVDVEFTDTDVFSISQTYTGNSRVQLSGFAAYNTASTYTAASNIIVTNGGYAYLVKNNSLAPAGIFVPADWYLLGAISQIFYVKYPYPLFDYKALYNKGDRVFWKGKVYQALQQSQLPSHFEALQAGTISNIPLPNIFPNDLQNGKAFWGEGVPYSFSGLTPTATASAWAAGPYTAGQRVLYTDGKIWQALVNTSTVPGDDITQWQPEIWTVGDNRSQQLVKKMVDVTLYHLHSRIAPRNIPELRVKNYDDAIKWLEGCAHGNITPQLPLLQPRHSRISAGGDTRKDFNY